MKKVLVTTKLLKLNEIRMSKLWDVKLNSNNEVSESVDLTSKDESIQEKQIIKS